MVRESLTEAASEASASVRETLAEAHVSEREMLVDVKLSDGNTAPLTAPAAKFSRTPTSIRRAAPALGEHTREILDEFGVTAERYEQLRLDNIV